MPNEEILTALKNAIDHGESLESAEQIMINSGYNLVDVQEATRFTSAGSINLQPEPEEELVMPEQKKSLISKLKFWGKNKAKKEVISKPSESMKLSSESTKKQKIIPTQTQQIQQLQTQQIPVQQAPVQQTPSILQQIARQQPVTQQTRQIQQPVIQQTQQAQVQQAPVQQKPSILQQIARQQPKPKPRQKQLPRLISRKGPLAKNLKKIKPKGTNHKKEIMLVIILLILIGVLVLTIMYKETILGWFS